jgi:amino acid transporter
VFERFKRDSESTATDREARTTNGRTAVAERPEESRTTAMEREPAHTRTRDEAGMREEPATRRHVPASGSTAATTGAAVGTREHMHAARARQREEFGGINWGAAFFGWLVAVGLGSLLVAILAAAGAAVGLTENVSESDATANAETIGLGGAIALLVVLMIAYYCGGYVAGRMSRFDGARQGFGAWMFGIAVTILLALAAVILGSEYNVLEQLNLPSLPVGDSTLTTGGAIALAAVVLGTLLAAVVGGKAGERYHRKVDRVGFVD